jgi:uncharacterized protein (TIGR02147 family)
MDYYEEVKAKNPNFSYQVFSEKAGMKSRGFLYNVVHGKRPLSKCAIFCIAQAIELTQHETDYFECLVSFNQSQTLQERNFYYNKMSNVKVHGKEPSVPQILRHDQFAVYSQLHHSVIRSLIGMLGFSGDYEALARSVYPRITTSQARQSVELLMRLKLIEKQKDGSYILTSPVIATPPQVASLAVQNFHKEAGEMALKALNDLPGSERNLTGVTMGISSVTYGRICNEIAEFRAKLIQIAEADAQSDSVYHLNIQLFPVSKTK